MSKSAHTAIWKLPARWIWTWLTFNEFVAQLGHHDWSFAQCWDLAVQTAEANAEDNNDEGWLIGRHRNTPSYAVQSELQCWSD